MRYDIKHNHITGKYEVVDTANRNAPLWGEEFYLRAQANLRADELNGRRRKQVTR